MVGFFFSGVFLGNVIALDRPPTWFTDLFTAIATLLAAYLGAHYAFRFSEKRAAERRAADEVSAGNQAIFNLIKAYNKFAAIHLQFIDPHRDSQYRAFEILPTVGGLGGFEPESSKSIAFLLESDDPDILNETARLESEIITTLELIQERSWIHRNEVQPGLEAANVSQGDILREDDINEILGERVVTTMEMATDHMINGVESVLEGCKSLIPRLHDALKKRHPEHVIISMEEVTSRDNPERDQS
ncbi:hypothetical protein [Salinisphaera sp. PC39]|uniref:hypothetical protein n=1 Tax=Salinisphaera sp. PC39 TaxID=1304156 RepID=UPI003341F21C